MNITCPLCRSNSKKIGRYLFNVDYDKKYFGEPNIFNCTNCNLSFVDNPPPNDLLEIYYKDIYRSEGRPHFRKSMDSINDYHYAAVNNLMISILNYQDSSFNKGEKVKILEIGAGWGELGQLLNTIYPNKIEIFTIEPCAQTQSSLLDAGYKLIESNEEIKDNSLDAVISLHVLEHFAIPSDFIGLFNTKLKEKGYLYLEVPNCRFLEGYEKRIYDSPHLTFWNSESLKELGYINNLNLILMYTSGVSIYEDFKYCKIWRDKFFDWTPSRKNKIDLKNYFFKNLKKFLKIFNFIGLKISKFSNSLVIHNDLCSYEEDNPNYSTIRTLYQKNISP